MIKLHNGDISKNKEMLVGGYNVDISTCGKSG